MDSVSILFYAFKYFFFSEKGSMGLTRLAKGPTAQRMFRIPAVCALLVQDQALLRPPKL